MKHFTKICSERIDLLLENGNKMRILYFVLVVYCIGVVSYAGIGKIIGFPFWATFGYFFASLALAFIGAVISEMYRDAICENTRGWGSRSWFVHFIIFFENILRKMNDGIDKYFDTLDDLSRAFSVMVMSIPLFPLAGIAFAISYALLLIVILLDLVRIAVIGFANLCLAITPKTATWAYVLWAVVGAESSAFFYKDPMFTTYFFMGITMGGLIGICLTLYKDLRKIKYGTPYFPT